MNRNFYPVIKNNWGNQPISMDYTFQSKILNFFIAVDLSTVAADEKVENQEKTDSDKDKSADSDTKDKPEEVKDKPKTEKEIEEEKKKVNKALNW